MLPTQTLCNSISHIRASHPSRTTEECAEWYDTWKVSQPYILPRVYASRFYIFSLADMEMHPEKSFLWSFQVEYISGQSHVQNCNPGSVCVYCEYNPEVESSEDCCVEGGRSRLRSPTKSDPVRMKQCRQLTAASNSQKAQDYPAVKAE